MKTATRASGLPSIAGLRFGLDSAWGATGWYVVATLAMTWPLASGIASDVPSDLGDPLLNCWILAWNIEHLLRLLGGDLGAFAGYWNANIFHPEPLALAYSEHLFAQSVQALPIYAISGNILLTYNLLFLSTFVLSGLGTYLLVRELTGSAVAAFGAGLLFAFTPYRVAQFPHLQILSSQWMPFALLGFRRFFVTGRYRALAGAAAALVAQNLSCGYYLLFFFPFVAAYAVYELWTRERLRDLRSWGALAVAGVLVVLVTLPFLLPYRQLRSFGNQPRSIQEVSQFSADVYAYATTTPAVRLWGRIADAFLRPEGELFPGVIPVLLAGGFLLWRGRTRWRSTEAAPPSPRVKWLVRLFASLAILSTVVLALMLMGQGGLYRVGSIRVSVRDALRPLVLAAVSCAVLVWFSPRVRAFLSRRGGGSSVGFFTGALLAAAVLSFGPRIRSMGKLVSEGPYLWLYEYVPGYDGLRVPAREGMLVMLFLAVLAGYGLHELVRRGRTALAAVLCALFLIEATAVPISVNGGWVELDLAPSPPRVYVGDEVPPVYLAVRSLPAGTAVAEFPFGPSGYELLSVFYAAVHWKPIVNGYSGGFPPGYLERRAHLYHALRVPEDAWKALASARPTHVIVHRWAYTPDEADRLDRWLLDHGASRLGTFEDDTLYQLPPWGAAGRLGWRGPRAGPW